MSGIEIIRQNLVSEWILMMRSNEGISLIKIHSLTGFCFYPVMFFFFNIFLLELFIFI